MSLGGVAMLLCSAGSFWAVTGSTDAVRIAATSVAVAAIVGLMLVIAAAGDPECTTDEDE